VTRPSLPGPAIAAVFFGAALLSRASVLSRSVLDWDESLYFLMAQQWRHGHLPYTTIWDNKPLGIYAIFALFQMVFGAHILAMRLASVAFTGLLGFTTFHITERLTGQRPAAWVAGFALILCALSNDGLSANTELFMASFTALAMLTALGSAPALLAGLFLGMAFMLKYVALFEAPALAFLLLARPRRLRTTLVAFTGAALPLAATVALYAQSGHLALWWASSVVSNLRRVNAPFTAAALGYAVRTELWRWGPLFLAGLALIAWALIRRRRGDIFLALWLLCGCVGVASAKSFYDHYFLQIMPVLCVILGVWFARLGPSPALRTGFVLAALALPGWAVQIALRDASGPDTPALVAVDLKSQPGSLYVFDSQPILYALTDKPLPTRYVLPSELIGNFLPAIAGVNAPAEVARILAAQPDFIVRRLPAPADPAVINPTVYAELDADLAQHYQLWRQYNGVAVYKLRSLPAR
jgi:4-amino-4-deoxy-L-arabinose transferase-like glycosyltransferase